MIETGCEWNFKILYPAETNLVGEELKKLIWEYFWVEDRSFYEKLDRVYAIEEGYDLGYRDGEYYVLRLYFTDDNWEQIYLFIGYEDEEERERSEKIIGEIFEELNRIEKLNEERVATEEKRFLESVVKKFFERLLLVSD